MNDKVYIVVLNYNDYLDTIECLTSLYNLDYLNYQVIVCDNCSDGDDVQQLLAWQQGDTPVRVHNPFGTSECVRPSKVVVHKMIDGNVPNEEVLNDPDDALIILQADCNRGFSAGNNLGLRYAQSRNDYQYIWFLNNDTVVDINALREMVIVQKNEQVAGVGSVIRYYDSPEMIQQVGSNTDWENMQLDMKFYDANIHEVRRGVAIDNLPGPSFMLTKPFVDKIVGLDEAYFLYCEEPDLGARAKRLGEKFTYATGSYIYHKGGCTTGQRGSGFRDYHMARSWTILLKRYAPDKYTDFKEKSVRVIKKRLKHLHLIRAYSVYKGLRDGYQYE